jgi:hypothetical protein
MLVFSCLSQLGLFYCQYFCPEHIKCSNLLKLADLQNPLSKGANTVIKLESGNIFDFKEQIYQEISKAAQNRILVKRQGAGKSFGSTLSKI